MRVSKRRTAGLSVGMLALAGLVAAPTTAAGTTASHAKTTFNETDLVSDIAGRAQITDPSLVNPWGISHGPATPLWVSNNGTDSSTLYATPTAGTVSKVPLTVAIPGGAPTGQVFHDPADATNFVVSSGGKSGPAVFIFDSEAGVITAWSPSVDRANAIQVGQGDNAVYKGLALADTPFGQVLLAADFRNGRIDVFDHAFHRLSLPDEFFHDPSLPAGYAPFNVAVIGDAIYVTYAKQNAAKHDEVDGAGLGIVDVYTDFGLDRHRFASHGALNAPWAVAMAPASFGTIAGDILVGNFGDGRINVYDRSGRFDGPLRTADGKPLVIDGLWGLLPGTTANGGTDALWFAAGINHEADGLLGLIRPNA
jgi:uncharacterized protein (TIGR03118 family)